MEFAWDCVWCGAENWVFCPDVGFWGVKYRAPDFFDCWACDGKNDPVFD